MQLLSALRHPLFLALLLGLSPGLPAEPVLGEAPQAPKDVSGLPGGGMRPRAVSGGFGVDTSSREQVRGFYNAVYLASEGVAINSTAVVANCLPGTNSPLYVNATLRRINWFRALAGLPAAVTLDAAENAKDQAAALMMSEHGALQHTGNWSGWGCASSDGISAAGSSNLALGNAGPDAITAYIWDFGSGNYEVGHRRWILYPQTQVMGTGDVPSQGNYNSANATWVFDANYGGLRPETRTAFVAWPPAGYAPYQVVYPQWSFAVPNADFSAATVTMTSNGVALPVKLQPVVSGYGENTLVWYPANLDPATMVTFPFNGADTVYGVSISNVLVGGVTSNFTYQVTAFDPLVPGADYFPLGVSGTNLPAINAANLYSCTTSTNPSLTGYRWQTAQATNGNLVDNAQNGTTNFIVSPAPTYPMVTNGPNGSGLCFHLTTHTNPVARVMQLKAHFFPTNTTVVSFKSLLGYADPSETARLQVSTDGGANWRDIFTQAGTDSAVTTFTSRSFSLASYAGQEILLRFVFDFTSGGYYTGTGANMGWCLQNIVVTNTQQLIQFTTNWTAGTNFIFTPTRAGDYVLQAGEVIFNDFSLSLGTVKRVTAVVGPPVMILAAPQLNGNQVVIPFALSAGSSPVFRLLQAEQLAGPWVTNTSAVLVTNVPGSAFQFTASKEAEVQFYRVQTP